ncbi:hypothetical protein BJ138DRAFT_1178784 [Hygrophoropsis aurantiaca]|uniref:Uncharacterized protein n=1 Tax=Hygrophoropsis aurantiaca TaxID=72124 RepID=A0ACB8AH55_9AGAM|nr:hypothetical protein BJ138DRAFT_1178784 [Hygrophoropsis aurantiaca]
MFRSASKSHPSLPSPGRNLRFPEASSPQRAHVSRSSNLSEAQNIEGTNESDCSIEIMDGICISPKSNKRHSNIKSVQDSKSLHPLFLKNYSSSSYSPDQDCASLPVREQIASQSKLTSSNQEIKPKASKIKSSILSSVEKNSDAVAFSGSSSAHGDESQRARSKSNRAQKITTSFNSFPDPTKPKKKIVVSQATSTLHPTGADISTKKPNSTKSTSQKSSNITAKKADTKPSTSDEPILPVYSFSDYRDLKTAVVYTQNENEANDAVQNLKSPLGFDLEWRVMWHAGATERRTALVQLCDKNTILLIQVSHMKRFPQKVLEVIESPDFVKTGANILNDGEKLFRDFGIQARNLVELGALAKKADEQFSQIHNRKIVGLAKMVSTYLGKTLEKGKERTSNWEANLNDAMVQYAANDAHSGLMVYHRLEEIANEAGKTLSESNISVDVKPKTPKPVSAPALASSSSSSSTWSSSTLPSDILPEPPRPQYLRAYNLWHHRKMPLDQMCMTLKNRARVEPLKESTVISYVVGALQADTSLPFDMDKLKSLVRLEASSWQRHRQWIQEAERQLFEEPV